MALFSKKKSCNIFHENRTNLKTVSAKMHINITFDKMKLVINAQQTGIIHAMYTYYILFTGIYSGKKF